MSRRFWPLITQGTSNGEVAELTYLKPNTVTSYIRSTYRKIGATSRTQAVLCGVRHGFVPDQTVSSHGRRTRDPAHTWISLAL